MKNVWRNFNIKTRTHKRTFKIYVIQINDIINSLFNFNEIFTGKKVKNKKKEREERTKNNLKKTW